MSWIAKSRADVESLRHTIRDIAAMGQIASWLSRTWTHLWVSTTYARLTVSTTYGHTIGPRGTSHGLLGQLAEGVVDAAHDLRIPDPAVAGALPHLCNKFTWWRYRNRFRLVFFKRSFFLTME